MATDLTLNGGISAGGDLTIGGDITASGAGKAINCTSLIASGALRGATLLLSGAGSVASLSSTGEVSAGEIKMTPEGGLAIYVTNKTGAPSVQGTIVSIKSGVDMCAELTPVDATHCLGVVYNAGVADNEYMWVVIAGLVDVLMKNNSTAGHICRIPLNTDDGEAAGYAMDASQSTSASVYKIGDILESKNAETLCTILIH